MGQYNKGHWVGKKGLEATLKAIKESMGSAAVFTIGMRKDGKYDILEVKASRFGGEIPDIDDIEEEFGELPKPGRLKGEINYIG